MKTKRFDYNTIEPILRWYWQEEEVYNFDGDTDSIIIDTPPPFANGKLHHGHGMSYIQLDILARYNRLRQPTLLPLAFDDNGLPIERFTEEKYAIAPGEHHDDFYDLCRTEAKKTIEIQKQQFDMLGFSYNHQISYTTIDEEATRITQEDFLSLYNNGLISHEKEPQLYCPHCQTALAQADVDKQETSGTLHRIRFPGTTQDITIATTRPELIPAAVAIFYHSEDGRYDDLSDTTISSPWDGSQLPLLPDDSIDREFGSGLMMCATFGDTHDIELYRKHQLEIQTIIDTDGRIIPELEHIGGDTIPVARAKIIEILQDQGHWISSEQIQHQQPQCERCSTPIEIIESKQWKLDILPHKDGLKAYAREIEITPSYMEKRLINWIDGLQWNWIISRQRIYGIQIPIWHCNECGRQQLATTDQLPLYRETMAGADCAECDAYYETYSNQP